MNASPSHSPTARHGVSWLRVALTSLPLIHLFSAAFHVYCGVMNADEGFYAIAARSVMEGDMLYRDFGYTQLPVLPYVNGPLLALTGYGLFEQRWVNGMWGLLALLLAVRWVSLRSRMWIALALAASFSLSPAWMHYVHLGKTYGFTSFIVMLATWVFVSWPGGVKKQCVLGLLGVIGVGCRLPSAPFFAIVWLAAFWHYPPWKWSRGAAGVLGVMVPTALLFAPFFLQASEASRFWMFDFHALSVPHRVWPANPEDIVGLMPAWWLGASVLAVAMIVRRQIGFSRETIILMASLAALAPNTLPRGIYIEYAVPFLLPFAGAVACGLHRVFRQALPARRLAVVATLVVAQIVTIPALALATRRVSTLSAPQAWLPPSVPSYTFDLPARLARARSIVEQLVPPTEPLLGPNLILAAETGRAVPRNARMGPFTMTSDFDADTARRLNLLTYPEFSSWLADPKVTLLAFFTTPRANYAWSVPSFKLQPRDEAERWLEMLRRDFLVVQQDPDFLLVARPAAVAAIMPSTAPKSSR